MLFHAWNKTLEVQNFVLKTVNNNCPELKAFLEGPRRDKRVNIILVVLVVPLEDGKLQTDKAFHAVTRELSITGVGIVLDRQRALNEVILGFRNGADLTYVRAEAKHLSPMGGGFFLLGSEMLEIVHPNDYPELKSLMF